MIRQEGLVYCDICLFVVNVCKISELITDALSTEMHEY